MQRRFLNINSFRDRRSLKVVRNRTRLWLWFLPLFLVALTMPFVSRAARQGARVSTLVVPSPQNHATVPLPADQAIVNRTIESYGDLPLSFEGNDGQFDSQATFRARGDGYGLFLTKGGAVLSLRKHSKQEAYPKTPA